jgi:hypothetical protein
VAVFLPDDEEKAEVALEADSEALWINEQAEEEEEKEAGGGSGAAAALCK